MCSRSEAHPCHMTILPLPLTSVQLSTISECCTSYFEETDDDQGGLFLSQSSEVYAFGSNSSSQLAMRSSDKFHAATLMPHMEDVQVVSGVESEKIKIVAQSGEL